MSRRLPYSLPVLAAALVACGGTQKTAEPENEPPAAAPTEAEQVAAIADAVNAEGDAAIACWEKAAAETPDVDGRVVIAVDIGEDGKTAGAEVVSDEIGDHTLTECLLATWRAHAWPPVVAGLKIQLPPYIFVAPAPVTYVLSASDMPADEMKSTTQRVFFRNGDGPRLILRTLKDGGVAYANQHGSDQAAIVVALSGRVRVGATLDKDYVLGPGQALYDPESDAGFLDIKDGKPSTFLQWVFWREPVQGADAPPVVAKLGDVKSIPIAGGKGAIKIVFDAGVVGERSAYLGVLTAKPGMVVPPHTHKSSTEALWIVQGEGEMTVNDSIFHVAPQTAIRIPPGTEHSFRVTSTEPVIAYQIYSPSGPEQRFKK